MLRAVGAQPPVLSPQPFVSATQIPTVMPVVQPLQYGAPALVQPIPPMTVMPPATAAMPLTPMTRATFAKPRAGPMGVMAPPPGHEWLQVTIFGTHNVPGAEKPVVSVNVAGKETFDIETEVLTGPALHLTSAIMCFQPGDTLSFKITEGDSELGSAQLVDESFYPAGYDGLLNVGEGDLQVKLVPLGQQIKVQDFEPVVVHGVHTRAIGSVVESEPVVAGMTPPHIVSPAEFEQARAQPGAEPPVQMTREEVQKLSAEATMPVQVPPPAVMAYGQPQMWAMPPFPSYKVGASVQGVQQPPTHTQPQLRPLILAAAYKAPPAAQVAGQTESKTPVVAPSDAAAAPATRALNEVPAVEDAQVIQPPAQGEQAQIPQQLAGQPPTHDVVTVGTEVVGAETHDVQQGSRGGQAPQAQAHEVVHGAAGDVVA